MMHDNQRISLAIQRRRFLQNSTTGMGAWALASLMNPSAFAGDALDVAGAMGKLHFAPKAKRIIYLFQNGAPSQLESFDYKPLLNKMVGQDLPESIRQGERLTGMTSNQDKHEQQLMLFPLKILVELST